MPKLTLRPSGQTIMIDEQTDVLTALKASDLYVKSSCGGHATCSDCIIKVVSGEDYLSSPPFDELKLLGNVFHITKERLACQLKISGDVCLDLSSHDKAKDQAKTRSKTSNFKKPVLRTKADREAKREQAIAEREANPPAEKPPKQSGFKRPKR